jgi:hypothetical protein
MSTIRRDLVQQRVNEAFKSVGSTLNFHIHHFFSIFIILADYSLTENEKIEAIRIVYKDYDQHKIRYNEGIRRVCENCNKECLATLYCEYCIRNYLEANFSNWTSGNKVIDNLIQKCQSEALMPNVIIEWIPYSNLQYIKYLTKGGFSKVYEAGLINGGYEEWDPEKRQLERIKVPGVQDIMTRVILKELENVENANQSWIEEVCNLKYLKFTFNKYKH